MNQHFDLSAPVPWIVGECATSCLSVIVNPLNKVYGKVSKFLQKAPAWEPSKIPSYWIDKILLHPADVDGGRPDEVNFLLDLLVKGLRSKAVSCLDFPLGIGRDLIWSHWIGCGNLSSVECLRAYPCLLRLASDQAVWKDKGPTSPLSLRAIGRKYNFDYTVCSYCLD